MCTGLDYWKLLIKENKGDLNREIYCVHLDTVMMSVHLKLIYSLMQFLSKSPQDFCICKQDYSKIYMEKQRN